MRILGISGGLQARSTNSALIVAAAEVAPAGVEVEVYEGLGGLPHFNPDLDGEGSPASVVEFRERLRGADGVIVATPEYAHSFPGVLKNGLDWVVGSGELMGKPVALLSASPNRTGGILGQLALVPTLVVMDAVIVAQATFHLGRKGLDDRGRIADARALAKVEAAVRAVVAAGQP